MTLKRSSAAPVANKPFEKAFRRFVELVEPIGDVQHVLGFEEDEEVLTLVSTRDEAVWIEVFHAQDKIIDEFPDTIIEFHLRTFKDRELKTFVNPPPPLTYSREGA